MLTLKRNRHKTTIDPNSSRPGFSAPYTAPTYVPYPTDLKGVSNGPSQTVGWPAADKKEFRHNTEERCAVVLVLDRSFSMEGLPLKLLNDAVGSFKSALMEQDNVARKIDVAVCEFDHGCSYHAFENARVWEPPKINAGPGTNVCHALNVALDAVAQRKDEYRLNGIAYHRPWIVLLTDGYPVSNTEAQLDAVGKRVREAHDRKKVELFPILIDDPDSPDEVAMSLLREKIAPPGRTPKRVAVANFHELFVWLSRSMGILSGSTPDQRLTLPDTSGWAIE